LYLGQQFLVTLRDFAHNARGLGEEVVTTLSAMPRRRALFVTVLLPFSFGYYVSYLARSVNAVLAPQLAAEFALKPADLGLLTSIFFFTFAACQLPLGVIFDRYGPRRVLSGMMLISVLGSALFAVGTDFTTLAIGRALMGLGVAGCMMGAFQATALWWSKDRLPLVNMVITFAGALGALTATVPEQFIADLLGWRAVLWALAILIGACAAMIFLVVPEREELHNTRETWWSQIAAFPLILRSRWFWGVGMLMFMSSGIFLSYQTLWAVPWFRDVAGLDPNGVANAMLALQFGMLVGAAGLGFIADKLRNRPDSATTVYAIGMAAFFLLLIGMLVAPQYSAALWFLAMVCGTAGFLVFAIFAQHFPTALMARISALGNLLVFVAAFVGQWGIGAIIGLWPARGPGMYDPAGHRAALIVGIVLGVAAFAFFWWTRRTADRTPQE
jgi:predicted MFS family arabinose efflux permease